MFEYLPLRQFDIINAFDAQKQHSNTNPSSQTIVCSHFLTRIPGSLHKKVARERERERERYRERKRKRERNSTNTFLSLNKHIGHIFTTSLTTFSFSKKFFLFNLYFL